MQTADGIVITEGMILHLPTSEGTIKGMVVPNPKTGKLFNDRQCVYVSYEVISSWAGDLIEGKGFWFTKRVYSDVQAALDFIAKGRADVKRKRKKKL